MAERTAQSAAAGGTQQGVAGCASGAIARAGRGRRRCVASVACAADHRGADRIRVRGLAKTHRLLKAGGAVEVAAVDGPVARAGGVADAAAGFLAAVRYRELPDGPSQCLRCALFQAVLV